MLEEDDDSDGGDYVAHVSPLRRKTVTRMRTSSAKKSKQSKALLDDGPTIPAPSPSIHDRSTMGQRIDHNHSANDHKYMSSPSMYRKVSEYDVGSGGPNRAYKQADLELLDDSFDDDMLFKNTHPGNNFESKSSFHADESHFSTHQSPQTASYGSRVGQSPGYDPQGMTSTRLQAPIASDLLDDDDDEDEDLYLQTSSFGSKPFARGSTNGNSSNSQSNRINDHNHKNASTSSRNKNQQSNKLNGIQKEGGVRDKNFPSQRSIRFEDDRDDREGMRRAGRMQTFGATNNDLKIENMQDDDDDDNDDIGNDDYGNDEDIKKSSSNGVGRYADRRYPPYSFYVVTEKRNHQQSNRLSAASCMAPDDADDDAILNDSSLENSLDNLSMQEESSSTKVKVAVTSKRDEQVTKKNNLFTNAPAASPLRNSFMGPSTSTSSHSMSHDRDYPQQSGAESSNVEVWYDGEDEEDDDEMRQGQEKGKEKETEKEKNVFASNDDAKGQGRGKSSDKVTFGSKTTIWNLDSSTEVDDSDDTPDRETSYNEKVKSDTEAGAHGHSTSGTPMAGLSSAHASDHTNSHNGNLKSPLSSPTRSEAAATSDLSPAAATVKEDEGIVEEVSNDDYGKDNDHDMNNDNDDEGDDEGNDDEDLAEYFQSYLKKQEKVKADINAAEPPLQSNATNEVVSINRASVTTISKSTTQLPGPLTASSSGGKSSMTPEGSADTSSNPTKNIEVEPTTQQSHPPAVNNTKEPLASQSTIVTAPSTFNTALAPVDTNPTSPPSQPPWQGAGSYGVHANSFSAFYKPPPLSDFARANGVIVEGWLEKRSSITGLWLKRFYVLAESSTDFCVLKIYQSAIVSSWGLVPIKLKTVIPLSCIETVESIATKSSRGREFSIVVMLNGVLQDTAVAGIGSGNSDNGSVDTAMMIAALGSGGAKTKETKLRAEDAETRLLWVTLLKNAINVQHEG